MFKGLKRSSAQQCLLTPSRCVWTGSHYEFRRREQDDRKSKGKKKKRPKNWFSKHLEHLLRALGLQTRILSSGTQNSRCLKRMRQICQQMFYRLLIPLFSESIHGHCVYLYKWLTAQGFWLRVSGHRNSDQVPFCKHVSIDLSLSCGGRGWGWILSPNSHKCDTWADPGLLLLLLSRFSRVWLCATP